MEKIIKELPDEQATARLGAAFAPIVAPGDVICLSGELGAGKSTFARGLIRSRTGAEDAPSPTFAFVETYETDAFTLWHFDLYRLETADDVWELGLEEALDGGVVLIEWPERIEESIPEDALVIRLDGDAGRRIAAIEADNNWSDRLRSAGIA